MSLELFDAIESHDLPLLYAEIGRGADPGRDHPRQPSWTPLKAAIEELSEGGPIEAVAFLLREFAPVDGGQIPGGATALIVAALNKQPEAVRLLLVSGADPNVRDNEGETPLAICTRLGDVSTASFLRACGAVE